MILLLIGTDLNINYVLEVVIHILLGEIERAAKQLRLLNVMRYNINYSMLHIYKEVII